MPLVFVSAWDRRASKYVRGETCDEIIKAAMDKLGVVQPCKLYIDSKGPDAGTEMDDDDIMTELAKDAKESGQKLTLFIAPENEKQVYLQGPEVTPAVQRPILLRDAEITPVARDIETTPTSRPQVDRYTSLPLLAMDSIVSTLKALKEKCAIRNTAIDLVRAKDLAAKSIAKEVVHHITTRIKNNFSREIATFYGDAVLNCDDGQYRKVFSQNLGAQELDDGRDWFICKIYNGLNYKKPDELKKKRPRKEPVSSTSQPPKKIMGLAKDYGCKNYAQTLPIGETPESQAEKMQRLKELHEAQDWGQAAESLFRQTFPSQRRDIIGTRPLSALATDFIPRWPIFQKGKFLLLHGELLTDVTVTSYHELLGDRSNDIIQYMRKFWANEEVTLRSNRRKRTAVAGDMQKIIKDMDDACTAGRCASFKCAAVFPLLCGFMGENFGMMAATVPVSASEEEIKEAISVANENPIILIQGESIFDERASFSVHILNRIKIDANNFLEAAVIWFLSFYVFDFCYTSQVQHTLEFFQRFLVGINPPTGDRRQNPKRHVSVASDRVVTLVEELRLASSPWVIPDVNEDDI